MNISTKDPEFVMRAERWIREQGEILVLFRYAGAAGSKDFIFFESPEAFGTALMKKSPQTSVIVFRQRQLPLRGLVDDNLIQTAREQIPDGVEFLIVDLKPQEWVWSYRIAGEGHQELWVWSDYNTGVGHQELEEWLTEMRGHRVALGHYPPWDVDSEDVMEAIVPDLDDVVRRGHY